MGRLSAAGWAMAFLCCAPLGAQERPTTVEPGSVAAAVAADSSVPELSLGGSERVRFFEAELQILDDGSVRVTEQITIWAQGTEFVHGIYRDLGAQEFDLLTGFKMFEPVVQSASLGGAPVRFRSEAYGEGIRVYLGNEGARLGPGQHTFELHYQIAEQVPQFGAVELNWQVTGSGWSVPVEQASIVLRLPMAADRDSVQLQAHGGAAGASVVNSDNGDLSVLSEGTLAPGEGLSLSLRYQLQGAAGAAEAAWLQRWNSWPRGHRWALMGSAALWAYFLLIWWRVGRDPQPGPRLLVFNPPKAVTPGGLRLIERMGHDPQCMIADILTLAVQGHLRIEQNGDELSLHKEDEQEPQLLPLAKLKSALFVGGTSLRISRSNGARLRDAVKAHRSALLVAHERQHFASNFQYWWPGLVIAAAVIAILVLFQHSIEGAALAGFMSLWLSGWSFGCYMLVTQGAMLWRSARNWGDRLGAMFMTLFALPFLAGELFGMMVFTAAIGLLGLLIMVALLVALIGFYHWLKAPTAAGRLLMDQMLSLREYLRSYSPHSVDEDEIDELLPYAFALDVADSFSGRLDALTGALSSNASSRHWYRNSALAASSWGLLSSQLGPTMCSAMRQATVKSSKSGSGRSSSGFSGGSGGRGGGGW